MTNSWLAYAKRKAAGMQAYKNIDTWYPIYNNP